MIYMNKVIVFLCMAMCFFGCATSQEASSETDDTLNSPWIFSEIDFKVLASKYSNYQHCALLEEDKELTKELLINAIVTYSKDVDATNKISLESHYFQIISLCSTVNDNKRIVVNGFCELPKGINLERELVSIRGGFGVCYITFEVDLSNQSTSPIITGGM